MKLNYTFLLMLLFCVAQYHNSLFATDYYVDAVSGNDGNIGTTTGNPWQTISKLNTVTFSAGDRILFKSNVEITGAFQPKGNGTANNPIYIGKYGGDELPIWNAGGGIAAIALNGVAGYEIADLDLQNYGGELTGEDSDRSRYGIRVSNGTTGIKSFYHFHDLKIHNVYPLEATPDESNDDAYKGFAIQFTAYSKNETYFDNVMIEDCEIYDLGYRAIVTGRWSEAPEGYTHHKNFTIRNCYVHNIGGSGVVPAHIDNLLVENNVFDHTGDTSDPRMIGRGSSIWPLWCKNVLMQFNEFKSSRGKKDSCGAHIDIGNENTTIQYNLSYDNEGGFAEFMGGNLNSIYRYNISINDGWRVKNTSTGYAEGIIFWLSGYMGSGEEQQGSVNSQVYNNTIYIGEGITTRFLLQHGTENVFKNNLLYVEGELIYDNRTDLEVDFDHNIYTGPNREIAGFTPGENSIVTDNAGIINPGSLEVEDYKIAINSIAKKAGVLIGNDEITKDYYNNILEAETRDIGAHEVSGVVLIERDEYYVNTESGDDTNIGSTEAPMKTMGAALAMVSNFQIENDESQKEIHLNGTVTEGDLTINTLMNVKIIGETIASAVFDPSNTRSFIVNGKLELDKLTFQDAYSEIDGGAIKVNQTGSLVISRSNFLNNNALVKGGAISSQGDLSISKSYFGQNYTNGKGGAISASFGTIHIENTTFHANYTIDVANGTLHLVSANADNPLTVTLLNNTFARNYADGSALVEGNAGGISGVLFEEGAEGQLTIQKFVNNLLLSQYMHAEKYNYGSDIQIWKKDYFTNQVQNGAIIKNNIFTNSTGDGNFPLDEDSGNQDLAHADIALQEVEQSDTGLYYVTIDAASSAVNSGLSLEEITEDALGNPRGETFDVGAIELEEVASIPVTIEAVEETFTYTGLEVNPSFTITNAEGEILNDVEIELSFDNLEGNPTNAGIYTYTVQTIGDVYEGALSGTVTIDKATVEFTIDEDTFVYSGEDQRPTVTASADITFSTALAEATSSINAGEYTLVVASTDTNYEGSLSATYTISKAAVEFTIDEDTFVYNGEDQRPTVTASVDITFSTILEEATASIDAGSYILLVTSTDANYEGSLSAAYTITKAAVEFTIAEDTFVYNGEDQRPTVTPSIDIEFTSELIENSESIVPGDYSLSVTSLNMNYEGEATLNYNITKAVLAIEMDKSQVVEFDGTAKSFQYTIEDDKEVSDVNITYNGSEDLPINDGEYTVLISIVDDLYEGEGEGKLYIQSELRPIFVIDENTFEYNGEHQQPVVTSIPEIEFSVVLEDVSEAILPGEYTLSVVSIDPNYEGSDELIYTITKAEVEILAEDKTSTYTGEQHEISYTIQNEITVNQVNVTYNESSEIPVNAGEYSVVIEIEDALYSGKKEVSLIIEKAIVNFEFDQNSFIYNSQDQRPSISAHPEIDFTTSLSNGTESILPGDYTLNVISNNSNYEGSNSIDYSISKKEISIQVEDLTISYTGIENGLTYTIENNTEVDNVIVTYNEQNAIPINVGTYIVKIEIEDALYTGTAEAVLTIQAATVTFEAENTSFIYNGEEQRPIISSSEDIDFSVSLVDVEEAILPGEYSLIVTSNDVNYEASTIINYTIEKAELTIEASDNSISYNGDNHTIDYTIEDNLEVEQVLITYNNSETLPLQVGEYNVKISLIDERYYGEKEVVLSIIKTEITFEVDQDVFIYNGEVQQPLVVSSIAIDLEIDGEDSILPGTYNLNVSALDTNYIGAISVEYTIEKAPLVITIAEGQSVEFNGEEQSISYSIEGDIEVQGVEITYNGSTDQPIDAGTYTSVVVINDERYKGEANGELVITEEIPTVIEKAEVQVKVYPNPSNGIITVECDKMADLIIYSSLGQVIMEKNIQGKQMIDISGKQNGVYILLIQTENYRKQIKLILND